MSVDVVVPSMGESVSTATIARWLKAPGDPVAVDEPLVALDSDKATMELPSPAAGVLAGPLAEVGAEVRVGQVIARVEPAGVTVSAPPTPVAAPPAPVAAPPAPASVPPAPASAPPAPVAAPPAPASAPPAPAPRVAPPPRVGPAARAALRQAGIDPASVVAPPPAAVAARPAVPAAIDEPMEVVPMTTLRRRIAERLVEAQSTAAMLTTFNEIDMSGVIALRERYQERFSKRYGVKLGFMSFFVKAAIEALKAFPAANAEIRGTDILYKHFFHIGVAVSGPRGLVVPVLRHADRLSFAETEQAIAAFSQKARENALGVDDLRGGTFTISNGGIFGSMMSTPILNPPQVAILGMHAIQKRAVVVDDQVVIRPMMYVAVTYDHRLLDGREAVSFLVRIKECVENPERVLLEV